MAIWSESGSHIITYMVTLSDIEERERDVWEISDSFREYLATIPEIVTYEVVPNGGMGGAMDNDIAVEIFGYDFNKTTRVANQVADSLELVQGARNVSISRDPIKPELQIIPNREKMALHGLNTYTIANAVRNRIEGPYMRKYREAGDEYDIVVRFREEDRNSISDINNMLITNQSGQSVRLQEIADIREYWTPPNIEHKSRQRMVSVTVTPYQTSVSELSREIDRILGNIEIPNDVYVESGGAVEDMQETFADLGLLLLVSLLLVYIVMASQFESLKMPFIIMFSIPFAFSGVILAHLLTGITMSAISMVGGIMLIGIVVKNAIVLVDYINLMRERGNELKEAIILSGRSRLRPVLMTSFTTILGMLPLAMSTGEGSEIWSPMGIAVIGGLIFSTFITLILVPVVYLWFTRRSARRKQVVEYDFMNGD
mgnify:FL=1